jgi:ubiquinone/menaquinone biosynthesis methyltransferase
MQYPDTDFLSTPAKKRSYNRVLFDTIAAEYDNVTPPLSFWRDRHWKRVLVHDLEAVTGARVVDFACGTGDLTGLLSKKYPGGRVTGADLSPRMLERARSRWRREKNISLVRTDMSVSPFRGDSADMVTGGYALRNAPDLAAYLREVRRVLKPGGRASFLDFSHPAPSLYATFQYYLLSLWGSCWGWLLHRDPSVYGYIAESLKVFPDRAALERLINDCGFERITTRTFFFGTIAIVSFSKPAAE